MSTPDRAASVLTTLKVRVSSNSRAGGFVHRRGLGDDQRHQGNGDESAAHDQRLAAVEQAQPLRIVDPAPPLGRMGAQHARRGRPARSVLFGRRIQRSGRLRKRSHPNSLRDKYAAPRHPQTTSPWRFFARAPRFTFHGQHRRSHTPTPKPRHYAALPDQAGSTIARVPRRMSPGPTGLSSVTVSSMPLVWLKR